MKKVFILWKESSLLEKVLLILRVVFGIRVFVQFGLGKIIDPSKRERLGSNMELIRIGFGFVVRGFLAALAESLGALCIALGILTRVASFGLLFTMVIAIVMHVSNGQGFTNAAIVGAGALLLLIIGGKGISLDKIRYRKCQKKKDIIEV